MDFNGWFDALVELDKKNIVDKNDRESFQEYFEDGDSPEDTYDMLLEE